MKRIAMWGLVIAVAVSAGATTTERWVVDSAKEMLGGTGRGVAVTDDGRLIRVPGWEKGAKLEEPVVLAGAVDKDGVLLLGTGNPALLYELHDGSLRRLADVPAQQVTSLLVTPSGRVFLGTLSPALVLEWRDGKLNEVGRLEQGGIWDLAWFDGAVVVAGGPPGSLYRLQKKGLERWVELPDEHARSLAVDGNLLLVGTSGKGLILSVDKNGTVGAVADSPFTEIADLLVTPKGDVWAAAVVGEPAAEKKKDDSDDSDTSSSSTSSSVANLKLPKVNGATAASEILRLTPEGGLLSVHRFKDQVVSALGWDGTGVLAGTGYEGEIWRFGEHGGARLAVVDAVQVTGLVAGGRYALTQGPAEVLIRREGEGAGTFRSKAESFSDPVRLGRFVVSPPDATVRIRFRSGVTGDPEPTWLPWTSWLPGTGGSVPLPPSKTVQWEVEIPGGQKEHAVERVEVAYREVNLAPRIEEIEVAKPGEVYLATPPPSGQTVDVSHPDVNGIFTVLEQDHKEARDVKHGKQYWRVGYRTVSWKVDDPNDDPLLFDVELERRDGFTFPVRKRLEQTQLAVDTTAVPDGWYRFRLRATDAPGNPDHPLEARGQSRWFVVDSTPPVITMKRDGATWRITGHDALSSLVIAEWSRDGKRWRALAPEDGLLDGLDETFELPAATGHHVLVVRLIDRQHNRAVAGAVEE
ncbi:MAG: hypothetical protein LJE95_11740 [Acidobacteria bacterium]|nr:hypothetical protein [Acidobacteriota bacterium]